ncbi:uncharacterized GPI-anchored protein At3g06035-like isoform X1 [Lycium barbarum]|uniref:uncharacterized GPI-anchored protein At3g06035-like isoform X1 n=1 Tax=Lycium barbarum TaxID=112863 RepID=UPI00293EFFE3|nr:uncharacterized GPI-anchored protein At3g06035-like isoform X1 [Lycium barbarum]
MASFRVPPAAFLFLIAPLLILAPVNCDDEEGHVLSGINSYRQSHNVPALTKHDKADCLADEIADELENQPCPRGGITPGPASQFAQYPKLLDKCDININTTTDGVILPVCVHDRVATLVITNYTQSQHARYLNNSKYTGAGIGTENDWTVLVLTTNTVGGSFASGATSMISHVFGCSHYLMFLLLGLFLVNYVH